MTSHTDDLSRKQIMGITEILELKKKSGMIVFGLMGLMVILMILPFAYAEPVKISVVLSDACKKSDTCIDLKDLASLDTTDQKISGKLYQNAKGEFVRSKPAYKNHWEFYRYTNSSYVVCVGCDLGYVIHSKTITVESNSNFKYVLKADHVIINNTRYEYNGRFIDSCSSATVSSDIDLIRDTIQYLGNNCKVPSKYNEKTTITKPKTQHTDCSYACLNAKFFKDAKAKSKALLLDPAIKIKTANGKVRLN